MIPPLARVSIKIVMPALHGRKDWLSQFGAADSDRVMEEAGPVIATVDPADICYELCGRGELARRACIEHRNVVNLTCRHRPVIIYVAPTRSFDTMRSLDDLRGVLAKGGLQERRPAGERV